MSQELDLPTPWGVLYIIIHIHYTVYSTVLHSVLPVFMGSAVRIRVLMTCLTHGESNPQPWNPIHQLYVSTGTGFNRLRDFRMVYPILLQWNQGLSEFFCPPSGIWTLAHLISTVNDLEAEGPLSESLRHVQLELGQRVRLLNYHSNSNKRPSSPQTIPCSCPPIAGLQSWDTKTILSYQDRLIYVKINSYGVLICFWPNNF